MKDGPLQWDPGTKVNPHEPPLHTTAPMGAQRLELFELVVPRDSPVRGLHCPTAKTPDPMFNSTNSTLMTSKHPHHDREVSESMHRVAARNPHHQSHHLSTDHLSANLEMSMGAVIDPTPTRNLGMMMTIFLVWDRLQFSGIAMSMNRVLKVLCASSGLVDLLGLF